MKAKTVKSEEVWKAPDGKKTIWNVTLESEGKQYPLKTFSEKIAEVGFEGDVESYANQRGDRFVKQIAKENGFKGQPRDDAAIKAQFSIKTAVQAVGLAEANGDNSAYLTAVETLAKEFYSMVERVKES